MFIRVWETLAVINDRGEMSDIFYMYTQYSYVYSLYIVIHSYVYPHVYVYIYTH